MKGRVPINNIAKKIDGIFYLNDEVVTRQEYYRFLVRTNKIRFLEQHPLHNAISHLLRKFKAEVDMTTYKTMTDEERYNLLSNIQTQFKLNKMKCGISL